MSKIELTTAPSGRVVTVEEIHHYARIGERAQDAILWNLIDEATDAAEEYTWRRFLTQTWDQYWDSFSGQELRLQYPPLSTLTHVKYLDTDGDEQTLSTSVYEEGNDQGITVIRLEYDQTWPSTRAHEDAVWARFVCGYGTAASVPEGIKQAIRMYVVHRYRNREEADVPDVFYNLLRPYISPDKYVHMYQGV